MQTRLSILFSGLLRGAILFLTLSARPLWAGDAPVSDSTYAVRAEYNVMAPMRDGVLLSTDIYRPDAEGRFPVILVRNPYGNGSDSAAVAQGRFWAARGYVYLHQDVRGRYDSEGGWYPLIHEANDGYDSQQWAGTRPWSNGKVGTLGASYLGFVQWASAPLRSPYLKAIAPVVSPVNLYKSCYIGGALWFRDIFSWGAVMDGRTGQTFPHDWDRDLYRLPLISLDESLGHTIPFWQDLIQHPTDDAYWQALDVEAQFDEIGVPALNTGGWYDIFLRETLAAYTGMGGRGRTPEARRGQRLLIGPWAHNVNRTKTGEIDFGPDAKIDHRDLQLRWMDHWLKGMDNSMVNDPPVKIFVMGENRWRLEQEWPLARTKYTKYYFHSQGRANSLNGNGVLDTRPPGQEPADTFTYDPKRPVPTKGGNLLSFSAGPFDQREAEGRDDVLVFTSAPLEADLEVTGPVTVTLYAASSAKDTDFTAKLLDVHPDGKAYNLADGIIRARYRESFSNPSLLEPGKAYAYTIDLWATSNVFKKGHRIRVDLSSSNFPRFDRNPNTGAPFGMDAELLTATQTIHHDSRYPSHILLPVIPR